MGSGLNPSYDLAACRKAAHITYAAFRELPAFVVAGMSERQLAWRMGRLLEKYGSQKLAFRVIVAFGEDAAEPHHVSTATRKLRRGDLIKVDAGAVYNLMRGDVTRTFFFGKPTLKYTKRYNAVHTAQQKAFPYFTAGTTGQEIDGVARDYLYSKKLGHLFIHSLGHGVGRAIHQRPWVTPGSHGAPAIQVGQVITNEPGVYEEGWGGIRIEDMIEVTKNGPKWLCDMKGKDSAELQRMIIKTA